MPPRTDNPYAAPRRSWAGSVSRAILIEAALLGLLLVCLHSSTGADNPVWFYLALILHFPASLLFVPLSTRVWTRFALPLLLPP